MKRWTIGGALLLAAAWTAGIFAADFNGDGTPDMAIFRPASGLWAVRGVTRVYFGGMADWPVAVDYDGDGQSDFAIFRLSSGLWVVRGMTREYFGASGDIPVAGDYDGLGTAVPAVFRPGSGLWAVRGVTRAYFGVSSDIPVPLQLNPSSACNIGIFRESSDLWSVRGVTRAYFGSLSDIPIPSVLPARKGVLWTGQNKIYENYDDGYYRSGRAFSYQTAVPDPSRRDEVVTIDNVTGLMWASDGVGKGGNGGNPLDWSGAVSWARDLEFAGYEDWRLPNLRELLSLVNYGQVIPAIDSLYFPNTRAGGEDLYWSSTSRFYYETDRAWFVSFCSGYIGASENGKSDAHYVRAVRGGR